VKLPEDYFGQVSQLPLKYGVGHPLKDHPVSNVVDPRDPLKVLTPLNCLTCHQPHASANADLLAGDVVNNQAFCKSCHKGMIGSDSTSAPGSKK
jgi:predicted CXXCH cytochrome family protein